MTIVTSPSWVTYPSNNHARLASHAKCHMTITTTFKMAAEQLKPSPENETTESPSTRTHSISSQLSFTGDENEPHINIENVPEEFGDAFAKFLHFDSMKEVGG